MDSPVFVIIAIVAAWLVLAAVVAVVIGRTAAAGEHARELDMMRREQSDATVPPDGQRVQVSTRPRS
ncbi:hypothetical protein [Microbacterium sp. CFBP9034]|uniref:hypothetical protein n=1 Tax=Microbacterium sp. CFBP9034 TaxID=3096540 RepID=UPI002A6AB01F|nr:hypothetical protein [Microbacterium sp. CFBP9034]MDY0910388.1 hypothetical protein [Microbacterium sp. CFBP9034]